MPLLRRHSSKDREGGKEKEDDPDRQGRAQNSTSIFSRLRSHSRSRSRSKSPNQHEEKQEKPTVPKLPSPELQPPETDITDNGNATLQSVDDHLSKEDVHTLFHGAPHFVLEKGRRNRYFPQAFFPWSQDLDISDLWDRRFLKHESFALATLHAHLPIPNEAAWRQQELDPNKTRYVEFKPNTEVVGVDMPLVYGLGTDKRPMFDLGIYERPNMLGLEGKEPGTVGMRHFLEMPVADIWQIDEKDPTKKKVHTDSDDLLNLSSSEALKKMATHNIDDQTELQTGKHAPPQDRKRIIQDGPIRGWRRVGVRNISMKTLTERFQQIFTWRDELSEEGWHLTVLDKTPPEELQRHLFQELLYEPNKPLKSNKETSEGHESSLKVQIEALVKVLTIPGAWLDCSIPLERLRFSHILHDKYSHRHGKHSMSPGAERKWLLIQLLLSTELVIRLSVALRLGVARESTAHFSLSSSEIHHFNKLRNLKVDWDLVVARRFLYSCDVRKRDLRHPSAEVRADKSHKTETSAVQATPEATEHHNLLGDFKHRLNVHEFHPHLETKNNDDECECVILPRNPNIMVAGVIRFATNIGWKNTSKVKESLKAKFCTSDQIREELLSVTNRANEDRYDNRHEGAEENEINHDRMSAGYFPDLEPANENSVGGTMSLSWLSGLIIPGASICYTLISTLLENDPEALSKLSSETDSKSRQEAYLHSGFVLDKQSWWSKKCIIARVMAPVEGSAENMGWINLGNIVPVYQHDEHNIKYFQNGWLNVQSERTPNLRKSGTGYRIFDGDDLAKESTPLGVGHGKISSREFKMITDEIVFNNSTHEDIKIDNIQLLLSSPKETRSQIKQGPRSAIINFNFKTEHHENSVSIPLKHDVYFISSHPCRPPHGHIGDHNHNKLLQHKSKEHLPAHPLHQSYKYISKSLSDLLKILINDDVDNTKNLPNPTEENSKVWIIDTRNHIKDGGNDDNDGNDNKKEIFVRSWCSKMGFDSLISRKGISCLSCTIREAKALQIGIIIRVGSI